MLIALSLTKDGGHDLAPERTSSSGGACLLNNFLQAVHLQEQAKHPGGSQDKAEEQRRRSESLQHKLEEMSKEKAAVEAHADLLEKALMKLSVDNSKPQSQAYLPVFGSNCMSFPYPPIYLTLNANACFSMQHSESDLQTQVRSPFSEETCKEVEGLEVADWGRTKENFTAAYQPQAHSTHAARTWRVYIEGQADLYSHLQVVEGPAFVPSQGWTTFDPRGSVVLSAVFDHPKTLKPEEAATIPLRDYARLWTVTILCPSLSLVRPPTQFAARISG